MDEDGRGGITPATTSFGQRDTFLMTVNACAKQYRRIREYERTSTVAIRRCETGRAHLLAYTSALRAQKELAARLLRRFRRHAGQISITVGLLFQEEAEVCGQLDEVKDMLAGACLDPEWAGAVSPGTSAAPTTLLEFVNTASVDELRAELEAHSSEARSRFSDIETKLFELDYQLGNVSAQVQTASEEALESAPVVDAAASVRAAVLQTPEARKAIANVLTLYDSSREAGSNLSPALQKALYDEVSLGLKVIDESTRLWKAAAENVQAALKANHECFVLTGHAFEAIQECGATLRESLLQLDGIEHEIEELQRKITANLSELKHLSTWYRQTVEVFGNATAELSRRSGEEVRIVDEVRLFAARIRREVEDENTRRMAFPTPEMKRFLPEELAAHLDDHVSLAQLGVRFSEALTTANSLRGAQAESSTSAS